MPNLGQLQGFPVVLSQSLDVAAATRLIVPSPPIADAGEIIQAALRALAAPVLAVLDRYARRIYIFTDAGEAATIRTALAGGSQSIKLAPDGGQSGNALTWNVSAQSGQVIADDIRDSIVVAQKPKKSAFNVLNLCASRGFASFAWLDQTSPSHVGLSDYADPAAVRTALENSAPDAAIELQTYTQGNFQ